MEPSPKAISHSPHFRQHKNQNQLQLQLQLQHRSTIIPTKQSLFDIALRFQKHSIDYPTPSYLSDISIPLKSILNTATNNKINSNDSLLKSTETFAKATDLICRFDALRVVVGLALERMDQADGCMAVWKGKQKRVLEGNEGKGLGEVEREKWVEDARVYLGNLEKVVKTVEEGLDRWREVARRDGK